LTPSFEFKRDSSTDTLNTVAAPLTQHSKETSPGLPPRNSFDINVQENGQYFEPARHTINEMPRNSDTPSRSAEGAPEPTRRFSLSARPLTSHQTKVLKKSFG
jgi:hypothetical protein